MQNAQRLYKLHQKLKRARTAVLPLLQEVESEKAYLEQVQGSLNQLEFYEQPTDLQALEEIREELIQQQYLKVKEKRSLGNREESVPYCYVTPSGFPLI